jgi:hypothetical protein
VTRASGHSKVRSPAISFSNRSAIFRSKSDPENYFSIAITIAIEKPIRINQTLIEKFSSNPDFLFSIKP